MTTMEGLRRRADGIADALAADVAVHRNCQGWIMRAIDAFAASGDSFTADDVRAVLPGPVLEAAPNLIPACFGTLARTKRIVSVGRVRSRRSTRKGAWIDVWQGRP